MATRKVWYALSGVLMIVCFVSFFMRGLNFAVDFTGGVVAEASFSTPKRVEDIAKAVEAAGFEGPTVQVFGSAQTIQIRLKPRAESVEELRPKFQAALAKLDPGVRITKLGSVGAQVGEELRTAAYTSLSMTLLLIGLYIILRFHTWRLSLGAIL